MNLSKYLVVSATAVLLSVGSAFALNETSPYNFSGDVNFDGPVKIDNVPMTNTAANLNQAGITNSTSRIDTNATTTTTVYVPRFVGDRILGQLGGTSTVFTAFGLTTNDWKAAPLFGNPLPSLTAGIIVGQTSAMFSTVGAGSAIVTGATTVGSFVDTGLVTHALSGAITVTNTALLAPKARYVQLTAAAAVTNLLMGTPANAGDVVTFVNTSTNAISIIAGGNLSSTNDAVLNGRRCLVTFYAQTATNWVRNGAVDCN